MNTNLFRIGESYKSSCNLFAEKHGIAYTILEVFPNKCKVAATRDGKPTCQVYRVPYDCFIPLEKDMPKDADGSPVKLGDKVRGEGVLKCQDNFSIDLTPVVTVWLREDGELMFGQLSAKSFPRFWIVK